LSIQGQVESAFTYFATKIDDALLPYTWYKEHVLVGARELNLPTEYIGRIELLAALQDPEFKREVEQLAIYR